MSPWAPPSCRGRFTPADFAFLVEILAAGGERQPELRGALQSLWQDPEALERLLDLRETQRALLESPAALAVSPGFYFYVLVRRAFLEAGLDEPALADYVAAVMAERVGRNAADPLRSLPAGMTHAADFIAVIESASGRMRFHLQIEAGNQFLVLTGLFPGFLVRRWERSGGPRVDFYEDFARRSFRDAADNRHAPAEAPRELLGRLAEALPAARRSLNRLAEEVFFLGA